MKVSRKDVSILKDLEKTSDLMIPINFIISVAQLAGVSPADLVDQVINKKERNEWFIKELNREAEEQHRKLYGDKATNKLKKKTEKRFKETEKVLKKYGLTK